jgi:hypothetical protein
MSHRGPKEGPFSSIPLQYIHLRISQYGKFRGPFLELNPPWLSTCPSGTPSHSSDSHIPSNFPMRTDTFLPSQPLQHLYEPNLVTLKKKEVRSSETKGNIYVYYMAQETNCFTIGVKFSKLTYLPLISPAFPHLLLSQNCVPDCSLLQWVTELIIFLILPYLIRTFNTIYGLGRCLTYVSLLSISDVSSLSYNVSESVWIYWLSSTSV